MLTLNISASSHVGRVRTNNEDMVLVGEWFIRNTSMRETHRITDSDRYIVALADGMGGHQSGEIASSEVLHNLQFFFSDIPAKLAPGDINEAFYEWLESINNTIDAEGKNEPKKTGMGTTLVVLLYYAGEFYWLNCGDSRLYRLHDGKLQQLTTDHSLNNLLGEKSHSNIITNCIGGGCKTSFIDIVQCSDMVTAGDKFLMCSDGLTDMLSDEDIEKLLSTDCTADDLCNAAEKAGGFDNVSVAVIKVDEE